MMTSTPFLRRTFCILFFMLLFFISLFLSQTLHRDKGYFNWQSEIWADKAGYYVYLPATFFFRFDPRLFPENIDHNTGDGFRANTETGKVYTKYTYGVAFLISPFFLATHGWCKLFSIPEEGGFAPAYHRMVNISAMVYLLLGLFFLKKVLEAYFKPVVQYLTLFFTFMGTHLLYYSVAETLMSHIYSFFLFALFLFALKRFLEYNRFRDFILFSFSFAFILLIRPSNILLFPLIFLWDVSSFSSFLSRVKAFIRPRYLLSFMGITAIVLLPQFFYWNYSRGHFIYYAYGEEGFSNWNHPFFPEVWFAPLNGLFLYTPMMLIMLAGMILMTVRKQTNGIIALSLFLAVSYLSASWETWYFGCSFGLRPMVEYTAIFTIPFGYVMDRGFQKGFPLRKMLLLGMLLLCSYYNYSLTLTFQKCFFGSTWDWNRFVKQINLAGIPFPVWHTQDFRNDFENQALLGGSPVSKTIRKSGLQSMKLDETQEYGGTFQVFLRDFPAGRRPETIQADFWIYRPSGINTGIALVCSVEQGEKSLFWKREKIDGYTRQVGTWEPVSIGYNLPAQLPEDTRISLYFWNPGKEMAYIDDLTVRFLPASQPSP